MGILLNPKFAVGDRVTWESISKKHGVGTVTFVGKYCYVVTPDNSLSPMGFLEHQLTREEEKCLGE